ncbi:AMP-binding protein [Thermodesulfobacteriota bacterium]
MYSGVKTLGAIVQTRADEQPNRKILRFENHTLTYRELDERSNRFANGLADLGLTKGDKAGMMLPNCSEFIEAWVGMTKAGVIEVPINTGYKGDLFAYLLNQAECRTLVINHDWLNRISSIKNDLETLRHIIVVGGQPTDMPGFETIEFNEFINASKPSPSKVEVTPFDTSVILFTAGTTGPSKGVVLTHNANFRLTRNTCELMGYGPGEVLFTAFPLFHINAKYTTVLAAMMIDGEAVLHQSFSASRFWDICRAEGVTAINYMGALLMMLHKQPERPDDVDNPVRKAFGAPAPITIYKDFENRFGVQLVEVYGMTELGTATMNTFESFRIGSCGKPVDYYEVEIHDEEDYPVLPGGEGEIVVRPKEPHVIIEEYYRMPEATLKAFRNLWFHTGDRGTMDEDGYFYFVDRMKDAIRRRGENISSWEVEKVITSFEEVQEAGVIGVPSPLTEEEVMAVVVLKERMSLTPEELLDRCQERLPHFAVPRYVRFVKELPKTPAERIEKYKLRHEGVTPDTWDREEHGYKVKR